MKTTRNENGTLTIESSDRMSNTRYHGNGKPSWWVRVGSGEKARFLSIGKIRGDERLNAIVSENIPAGTIIYIGVGPNNRHGIREEIVLAG